MNIQIRSLLFAILVSVSSALIFSSSSMAADISHNQNIGELTKRLENVALSHGVTIEDIKISRSVGNGSDVGITTTSCTATATISIPGGTGVELSATAPTCAQAIKMLEDAIAEYVIR